MLPLHVYVVAVLLFTHHGYSQKEGESCVIEHTNTRGVCARASSCQSARRDFQINGTRPTLCNSSLLLPIVCCNDEISNNNDNNNNNNKENRPVWTKNQQTIIDKKRISEKKCEEYRVFETVSIYLPLSKDSEPITISIQKCRYNSEEIALIVRGKNALAGEFPHMAAIGWPTFEGTYSFLCDGSLISTRYVLTAAHCMNQSNMKDPNPVIVRLGDQNLNPTKTDGASPIEVPIKSIRKHPQYKSPGKYHDIALLELASDIDFSEAIKPACLWNKPDFPEQIRPWATGWGFVDLRTMRSSDELQSVHLTLLENEHCNNVFRIEKNQIWTDGLTDNQLCAGDLRGEKDTCQGDSGSPLQVISSENKCLFYLIGVASFVNKCTQSGSPAVYTRVSSYLDWIESVVWPGES